METPEDKRKLNSIAYYHNNRDEIVVDKEKKRASQQKWYLKNKERILKKNKESYTPHPRQASYKKYNKSLKKLEKQSILSEKLFGKKLLFIKKSSIIGN
tara:strand:+ start:356 stop:652 length:297 start_codon:yes stop_codon:yes gene_type:complete